MKKSADQQHDLVQWTTTGKSDRVSLNFNANLCPRISNICFQVFQITGLLQQKIGE